MPVLHWLGREAHLRTRVPARLLEEDTTLARGEAGAPNLLVQGDNLEALRALLPLYAGRVKCIFIDPPYNTGAAFAQYDDNLEHATWLGMMWPRLVLLREFLAADGSIWVTMDDNEAHYLKVVMDEVFGRRNFVANVVWQKKYSRQNDAIGLSVSHDHIFAYARERDRFRPNVLARTAEQLKGYKNPTNDHRGAWQSVVLTGAKSRAERPNLFFPLIHPGTGREVWPDESRVWAYDRVTMERLIAEDRLWWGTDNTLPKPRLKSFLAEVKGGITPDTWWRRDEVGDNQDGKREAIDLNPGDAFATPKPEALLQRILHIATNPGDLVLDSFLGSGTTAAVAHKMGRRWIGIEMGEHALTHCHPRLEKVVAGEQGGVSQALGWQGGGGFRVLRLGPSVTDAEGRLNPAIPFAPLAAHLWFALTGAPMAPGLPQGPVLGLHEGQAIALLHNGVLGDRRPAAGNVLTRATLDAIRAALPAGFAGPLLVLGEATRLSPATMARLGITFRPVRAALEEGR